MLPSQQFGSVLRRTKTEPMLLRVRLASVVEATSYLALLVATAVKWMDITDRGVTVLGPIHGVLYLIFAALVLQARPGFGWDWSKTVVALVVGSLPLGGFWLERQWLAPMAVSAGHPTDDTPPEPL